jgi:hypothetical protein
VRHWHCGHLLGNRGWCNLGFALMRNQRRSTTIQTHQPEN